MRPAFGRIEFNYVVFAVAAIMMTAVALRLMGHTLICPCGHVDLWHGEVHGPENSQHLTDWWSATHVMHGFAIYALLALVVGGQPAGTRFAFAVLIECGWEIFENSAYIIGRYRDETAAVNYFGDSVLNSVSDIFFMMLGFVFALRLPVWASVVAALGLELAPLLLVRDNLTLNMIMLLHPIEAIRMWQLGAG